MRFFPKIEKTCSSLKVFIFIENISALILLVSWKSYNTHPENYFNEFFISSTLTFFPLFQVDLLQLQSRGIDYFISVFICVLYQILNKILGKNQIEKIIGSASAGTPTFIPGVSVNGKFLIVGGSLLQL